MIPPPKPNSKVVVESLGGGWLVYIRGHRSAAYCTDTRERVDAAVAELEDRELNARVRLARRQYLSSLSQSLLLALLSVSAQAQDPASLLAQLEAQANFTRTDAAVGHLRIVAARLCNLGKSPDTWTAAQFHVEAARNGVHLATHADMRRVVDGENRRSWQRNAALAIEVAAGIYTILIVSRAVNVSERWSASIPLTGGVVRIVTTAYPRREATLPANLFPAAGVTIPPGECREFSALGEAIRQ